jgi:hypothetical protein
MYLPHLYPTFFSSNTLGSRRTIVVFQRNGVIHIIVIRPSGDVDEMELMFHVCGHALREDVKFLTNVFFEHGPFPSTHFLYLGVRVPRECQCIDPAAA